VSEMSNTSWAEPLPECQHKSKLRSESTCGEVPRAMAKDEHDLRPCIGFDFKASDERKPWSVSCLALLIAFAKN